MIVVSDTGPLVALAKVDRLSLLAVIFAEVLIPSTVQHELFAKHGAESARLDEALSSFLRVMPTPVLSPEVEIGTLRLDPGEQHAIALAYERGALLVIDDRLGRAAARRLGLAVTGVAGVVVQAKLLGHISSVRWLLEEMRQRGYWLSDEVLDTAARLAEEA